MFLDRAIFLGRLVYSIYNFERRSYNISNLDQLVRDDATKSFITTNSSMLYFNTNLKSFFKKLFINIVRVFTCLHVSDCTLTVLMWQKKEKEINTEKTLLP